MTKPITIELPIETVSEANVHQHWSRKAARVKKQRRDAWYFCKIQAGTLEVPKDNRLCIKLTRLAPKVLDDDNLRSALKAVRDGIADWLKIDDGSDKLVWDYGQETISRTRSIRVQMRLLPLMQ